MTRTLISLGANLGNVHESMQSARRLLIDRFGKGQLSFSQLYRTPPVGGPDGQGDFLNAVVRIDSSHNCWEIWEAIKSIESQLGRQRQHRWEARRIDIDLILHDHQRIWTPHLKVPHPRMCMRTFVIKPAMEVADDWLDPVSGWTIHHLNDHLDKIASSPSCIRLLCSGDVPVADLQTQLFTRPESEIAKSIWWESAEPFNPEFRAELPSGVGQIKLTIAAVASPDPTTILWEDYSQPWVRWLNMESRNDNEKQTDSVHPYVLGPRYLMPANDPNWAVHEIIAATGALACPVEPIGSFQALG